MKITLIEKNRKNKDMLSVYTDGKFAFTISESNFLSLNLYEGMDISEETVDYVKNTLNFLEAKARAVRFLTMRLRTEKEVRDKLHEIGYDNECTEKVVNELKAIGYINDTLYAQKYIYDRSKLKPLSRKLMKRQLLLRGISEDIADEVLKDWKVDDFTVAKSLLKRKYGKYDINDEKIQKKARSFLMYRGFSISTINEVLRDMAEDADGQDEV
ncbi:MAG: regulatory protein RecX [Acetivibrionales bacterium]